MTLSVSGKGNALGTRVHRNTTGAFDACKKNAHGGMIKDVATDGGAMDTVKWDTLEAVPDDRNQDGGHHCSKAAGTAKRILGEQPDVTGWTGRPTKNKSRGAAVELVRGHGCRDSEYGST